MDASLRQQLTQLAKHPTTSQDASVLSQLQTLSADDLSVSDTALLQSAVLNLLQAATNPSGEGGGGNDCC